MVQCSQFGKRQENILLNALQFVNDIANNKSDDDDLPVEERGLDMGFECKLIPEQRDDPEFRKLIDEDDMNPIVASRIESYA